MASTAAPRALTLHSSLAPERTIVARGNRFELGRQQGVAQRAQIRRFLDDRLTRLEPIAGVAAGVSVSRETFAKSVREHAALVVEQLPGCAEEVHGLAEGAQIPIGDAWLLQLRRELASYRSVRKHLDGLAGTPPAAGDCTTFARSADGHVVLGQTIDLNGDMASELTTLQLTSDVTGRSLALASFTGLLGYLGVNDRGLAIGLNLVLAGDWRPGVPGYMAIRHLLDVASSVDECLALLKDMRLASSRALTIVDDHRMVGVEFVLDEMRVIEPQHGRLVHANHFLHEDFVAGDELNPFALNSSRRRQQACEAALDEVPADAGADAYFAFLDRAPVYVAPSGDVRRESTAGAVVIHPRRGEISVRQHEQVSAAVAAAAGQSVCV